MATTTKNSRKTNTKAKSATANVTKSVNSSAQNFKNLQIWHAVAGLLHALQAVLVVVLGNNFSLPVSANFLTPDALSADKVLVPATRQMFDVRIAWAVASFLAVAAVYHLLVATVWRRRYETVVASGVNRWRWMEFVLGSGLVLVTVAMLLGVRDLASLVLLFVVNEGVHLMGYMLEAGSNKYPRLPLKLAAKFVFGIAFALLWTVFATNHYGDGNLPNYLYWLIPVGLVCFALFAWVGFKYNQKASAASFVNVEKSYTLLGLVSKAAVAWIIFFGVLK